MRKNGTRPIKHDHRDYDLIKTRIKYGSTIPAFPADFSADAGLWMPNQNMPQVFPGFSVPALDEGCTDYAGADLAANEDKVLKNPMLIEAVTHANANGGADIRDMLKAVTSPKLWGADHPQFFSVQPDLDKGGAIDWFDAVRVAMIIGKMEGRAVTVGSPWYQEFENTDANGIIEAPTDWSLYVPGTSIMRASWHDWNSPGWHTINGQPYLISKPWIGSRYGDKGFGYFSRATFNRLMTIPGTCAFTLDKLLPGETPVKIDSSIKQLLLSFFYQLFGIQ